MQTGTIESLHECPKCHADIAAGRDDWGNLAVCDACTTKLQLTSIERIRKARVADFTNNQVVEIRRANPLGLLLIGAFLTACALISSYWYLAR